MALSPIHNQYLTRLATDHNGVTWFFIPSLGTAMWLIGSLCFVWEMCWTKEGGEDKFSWRQVKVVDLGDRHLFVPLLVIVGAIAISGLGADSWKTGLSVAGEGLSLFAVYLAARKLGKTVFLPLTIGAVVASLGVLLRQVFYLGQVTGGFVFENNYDVVVGYTLLGAALFIHRYQWLLAGLALLAMLASGSPEGVFAIAVIGAVILCRRDYGRRLAIVAAPAIVAVVAVLSLGYGERLYSYVGAAIRNETARSSINQPGGPRQPIGYRLEVIGRAMTNIKPLGEGYTQTDFKDGIVHNVPLIIVQQLGWPGIVAAIAWLWVSLWCLVKTRMKYAWALVLILSVWDHFIFTQLAPWWWALAGVSATATGTDFMFRSSSNG